MIGETLGSYRVTAKVGEGGMGAVYLAEHPLIGRKVAVKMLRPEYSDNEEAVSRFFREARSMASLRHPALVDVFDYGVHSSGSAYIVMDYLEGEVLESRLRHGPPPLATTVDFARQIAIGISAAHAAGIVHRDLKPGNVFVEPDPGRHGAERLKILDFGIAKLTNHDAAGRATRTDLVMGTPLYMSPEQCRGAGGVDLRADIYSLGCILYEMLCGRLPFVYQWSGELIAAHLHEAPRPPREWVPSIPAPLEAIVLRALAKSPDARQQSMEEVVAELDAYIATDPSMQLGPLGSGPPPPMAVPRAPSGPPREQVEVGSVPAPPGATAPTGGERQDPTMVVPTQAVTPGFEIAIPTEKGVDTSTLGRGASIREVSSPQGAPRRRNALPVAIGGVVAVAIAVLVARRYSEVPKAPTALSGQTDPPAQTATSGPSVPTPADPPPGLPSPTGSTNPVVESPQPVVEPPQPVVEPQQPVTPPAHEVVAFVRIAIPNARKGLTIRIDGRPARQPLRLARDGQVHELTFETPNFRPESRSIRADKDQTVVLANKPGFFLP